MNCPKCKTQNIFKYQGIKGFNQFVQTNGEWELDLSYETQWYEGEIHYECEDCGLVWFYEKDKFEELSKPRQKVIKECFDLP